MHSQKLMHIAEEKCLKLYRSIRKTYAYSGKLKKQVLSLNYEVSTHQLEVLNVKLIRHSGCHCLRRDNLYL